MKTIVTNKSLSLEKMVKFFGMVLMLFLSISNAHAQLLQQIPAIGGQILVDGYMNIKNGGVNADELSTGSAFVGTFPPTPASACFGNRALDHTTNINYALIQTNFGRTLLNAAPNEGIYFKIGNDTKMVLSSTGNFGIGTSTPAYNLDVAGVVNATEFRVNGVPIGNSNLGSFKVQSIGNDAFLINKNVDDTNLLDAAFALGQDFRGQTFLNSKPGQPIVFKSGLSENMVIESGGDVFISNNLVVGEKGTRKPGCVLMVDGRTYISEQNNDNHLDEKGDEVVTGSEKGFGDLTSDNYKNYLLWVEEGIVSADFAIAETKEWPDYVFKADYNLSSLSELEKSIKEKGHLPNMPAATEVEKNGFTVNDMTKRMVKTIEELTLYTIDQEKQLTQQKELVKTLMQRLEKLEAAAAK